LTVSGVDVDAVAHRSERHCCLALSPLPSGAGRTCTFAVFLHSTTILWLRYRTPAMSPRSFDPFRWRCSMRSSFNVQRPFWLPSKRRLSAPSVGFWSSMVFSLQRCLVTDGAHSSVASWLA
jgi:hypothetical protein